MSRFRFHGPPEKRYPTRLTPEQALARDVLHARLTTDSVRVLCEQGQDEVFGGVACLNLDHPNAAAYKDAVTCQGCLEWMHA